MRVAFIVVVPVTDASLGFKNVAGQLEAGTLRCGTLRLLKRGDASHHLGRTAVPIPGWPIAAGPPIYLAGSAVERLFWSTTRVYERCRYLCEVVPSTAATPLPAGERIRVPMFRITAMTSPSVRIETGSADGSLLCIYHDKPTEADSHTCCHACPYLRCSWPQRRLVSWWSWSTACASSKACQPSHCTSSSRTTFSA